ncbi:GNAT family N-acetyltransferase [Acaryochloris marina]|uniref:GNAT family N-acetyltransferase n=1 Tax=Acaryochloris marina TaxID=155978 RepID=UPI001BB06497|nr:GNAT family N-acetyltransferase [Acaryochloris marina]QUY43576.1 GNAT family N-acetyltransferase [Acaryochloris marina S15]
MNLNIRLARPADMEQVLDIQQQAIQRLCSRDYSPAQVDAIVQSQHEWRGQQELIYMAQKDHYLVGFIAFSLCSTKILGIYVHPDHTRQGIATQLLQYFERRALAEQRPTIEVFSSLTAVALYQSQGYVSVQKTKIDALGVSVPCLFMKKSVTSSSLRFTLPPSQSSSPHGFKLEPEVLWAFVCIFLLLLLFL